MHKIPLPNAVENGDNEKSVSLCPLRHFQIKPPGPKPTPGHRGRQKEAPDRGSDTGLKSLQGRGAAGATPHLRLYTTLVAFDCVPFAPPPKKRGRRAGMEAR
jgi:hypothetical protein